LHRRDILRGLGLGLLGTACSGWLPALAAEIAENTSAVSIALTRALLWHGLSEPDPQSAHLADSRCIYWCGQQPDAYEGVQSFLEKRPPKFYMSAAQHLPEFYPWWKEPDV